MISVLVPSRHRPELAKRLLDTINGTKKTDVEVKFYLNDNDPTIEKYKQLLPENVYIIGPDQSSCFSWNYLSTLARHDYCMLVGDDAQFLTTNWDQHIIDFFENYEYKDKILYVCPRDMTGSDKRRWIKNKVPTDKPYKIETHPSPIGAAHFVLHKNWINTVGYFLPPQFWHWHIDNWLTKLAVRLGRAYVLPHVQIQSKKMIDDHTGKRIRKEMNIIERDLDVWKRTRDRYLTADVEALQKFIKDYKG
tara:strand:+ start:1236 stop:1982 length:747 start_codon:yes stop_codon:yes gene_type:complete